MSADYGSAISAAQGAWMQRGAAARGQIASAASACVVHRPWHLGPNRATLRPPAFFLR